MRSPASFALTTLSNEGLLLDLRTGILFQLNESATTIWSKWLAGESERWIAHELQDVFGLRLDEAETQVTATLNFETEIDSSFSLDYEFLYERSSDGYTFSRDGTALLTVDDAGQSVVANRAILETRNDILSVLLSVSPKLAALRGHLVLHASAALMGAGATAFCGASGAGKTTTVRSLVAGGAKQICEDKLVLRPSASGVDAIVGAEEHVRSWAEHSADLLLSGRPAPCGPLDEISIGPVVALQEIGFVSADQRVGRTIDGVTLSVAQTAGRIFNNLFYGSDLPQSWHGQLQKAVEVARCVKGTSLTMPSGLTALREATALLAKRGFLRG